MGIALASVVKRLASLNIPSGVKNRNRKIKINNNKIYIYIHIYIYTKPHGSEVCLTAALGRLALDCAPSQAKMTSSPLSM